MISPSLIAENIKSRLVHFPNLFDQRLLSGLDRLSVNTPPNFFAERSYKHLRKLLLVQFFLQRKIEYSLNNGKENNKPLSIKLFQNRSSICCAIAFSSSYNFNKEQLFQIFHTLLPGISGVHHSSFMWFHPEFSYCFCYFEVNKIRGQGLSKGDVRLLEKSYREQLLALPPLTPALFWPYNAEESFRQVQLLQREMESPNELPHISIHFQEQTQNTLEFLIHYARPQWATPIEETIQTMPRSLDYFFRLKKQFLLPFPIEVGAFSIKVPSSVFVTQGSINLLYARRYISRYLKSAFGPFRDYNGGLFEKQQLLFEYLRIKLSNKIPLFDLFAEKIFYALQPVEARIALSVKDAERLFLTFSEILQKKEDFMISYHEDVIIIKNGNQIEWLNNVQESMPNIVAHAHLSLGTADYFCCMGPQISAQIPTFMTKKCSSSPKTKVLKLSFQEGAPPSLNPHLSSGDMRCRMLSKLLFEGLIRLNRAGQPEPAGARDYSVSPNEMHYVFTLKPCYWSNGDAVTAIDYVVSWQRALREAVTHPEQLFVIKNGRAFKEMKCDAERLGVRALDPLTLEIELERPDPCFLHKLATPFFFPLLGSMREPKWFNGPYHIRSQRDEGLLLEKNPYFWDNKRSFFEQIEIKWNHDISAIYQSFQEGTIDWIGDPLTSLPLNVLDKLQRENCLKILPVNRHFILHYNTKHPLLASAKIRRALGHAIEVADIQELFPHYQPITLSPLTTHSPFELFQEGLQELGLVKKKVPPLQFIYSHQRERLGAYLRHIWGEKLDLMVQIEQVEWNQFRTRLEKGEFEIIPTIHEMMDHASLDLLERFEGSSSWNFSQWEHHKYREILNAAHLATTLESKTDLLKNAKNLLHEEMPLTPLLKCSHLFAHHPKLNDYLFDSEGCIDFSYAYFSE